MKDLVLILTLTIGTCLAVGLLGGALLHVVRGRSLRGQLAIATLLPVVAVVATVVMNVRLMFLSPHDSTVILIALATALVLAVIGAWLVMRRITRASRQVGAGLQQLVIDVSGELPAQQAAPDLTPDGLPQELAHVLDELAETRRTLAQSRTREKAAEQSRRDLVTFMSHDLRTPLAGLRALAEGLEDGVIEDVPLALSHLRGTVSRMTLLVDDLFALSRVQGEQPKPQTLVSLTELIADVATECDGTSFQQGVRLDLAVPTDDRLAVLGSPDDLARALANLVTNAIRHTGRGGTVRVGGSRADDGHVKVAVMDGCGGIPPDALSRVFDTGWRDTPSRSGDDGRAGLGLAIARGVVESHAGHIMVCNVEGGCRFDIDLPATSPGSVIMAGR